MTGLAVMAIKWIVPNVSRDLRERIRREAYVTNEIIIQTELLKSHGKLNLPSDEEKDSLPYIDRSETSDVPLLRGESKSYTESDDVNTGDITDGK